MEPKLIFPRQRSGRDAHQHSLKMLAGAPKQLLRKAKLYQNCLREIEKQTLQSSKDKEATRYMFHHHEMCPQTHLDMCTQALIKLARRAEPKNLGAAKLVAFEMYWGQDIGAACIGHYLTSITVAYRAGHTVALAPRWVHDMVTEAVDLERTLKGGSTGNGAAYYVGEAYLVTEWENIVNATALWDPYGDGIYKKFSNALNAATLLG